MATNNLPGNEIFLKFNYSFIKQTTEEDQSFQSTNKTFALGYEWHLMRVEKSLRYFSLEFGLEDYTITNFELAPAKTTASNGL